MTGCQVVGCGSELDVSPVMIPTIIRHKQGDMRTFLMVNLCGEHRVPFLSDPRPAGEPPPVAPPRLEPKED